MEVIMKVLMLNSSTHQNGCTDRALREIASVLETEGIESKIVFLGKEAIRDCTACMACTKLGRCAFDDGAVNEFVEEARTADGFVFGTPVYYAHPTGRLLSFLDRAFYSGKGAFVHKPGAAVASARRAGTTASFDVINKYFTIAQMPVVSSTYWNMVHGACAADVEKDAEGLQTMRNLGRNMAWLLRCIEAGRAAGIDVPENEQTSRTNFVR